MKIWRFLLILVLVAAPFLAMSAFGTYYLWREQLMVLVWWPLFLLSATGFFLAWLWQRQHKLLPQADWKPALEWTDRDRQAWSLVEARAQAGASIDSAQFTNPDFYWQTAQEMARELAQCYHANTEDAYSAVTVTEVLAVIEFAAHDLAVIVEDYVPAGNLLTIRRWRQAKQLMDWYPTFTKLYWLVSAIAAPMQTVQRYLASQVGVSTPLKALQDNMLVFFYTAFVQRVGTYLIEMNSGRLRVGASRFLELKRQFRPTTLDARAADSMPDTIAHLTITVMGQVKAGKSSLINALLGEQHAKTDVLPATQSQTRYELQLPDVPTKLTIVDTVGYSHEGPRPDQTQSTREMVQASDLVLFVGHARNPARQGDVEMLRSLQDWFDMHPQQKRPPFLGVLTHIDLLSPMMEWEPPYDWRRPQRPKEEQIAQSVRAATEQLGDYLAAIVPVCAMSDKLYGVQEELLPQILQVLDEARGVAFVRCVLAEGDAGKARRIAKQILALAVQSGKAMLGLPPAGLRSL